MRPAAGTGAGLVGCIDSLHRLHETVHLSGWLLPGPGDAGGAIEALRLAWDAAPEGRPLRHWPLPSPDVAARHGRRAAQCRFRSFHVVPPQVPLAELRLVAERAGVATALPLAGLMPLAHRGSALQDCFFREHLAGLPAGSLVVEIGSRARSGIVRRELVPGALRYCGVDVVAGPNVDIVGDAHRLSTLIAPGSVAAVFSLSVFEHLLMPWKVAVEINRVLRPGGLVFTRTHQAWPVHDAPWDFWRFSDRAWSALFNDDTGFALLDTALDEPAMLVPLKQAGATDGIEQQPSFLCSAALARKTGETALDWNVDAGRLLQQHYPG